jgi:hypothetical protein
MGTTVVTFWIIVNPGTPAMADVNEHCFCHSKSENKDKAYETRYHHCYYLTYKGGMRTTFDETHHPHRQHHLQNSQRVTDGVRWIGLVEQYVTPALIPPPRLFLLMADFNYGYQQLIWHWGAPILKCTRTTPPPCHAYNRSSRVCRDLYKSTSTLAIEYIGESMRRKEMGQGRTKQP